MGHVLVTGSIAYDHLMDYDEMFYKQMDKENLDKLNISYLLSNLEKRRGGCAPNIAYGLSLLQIPVAIMGSVGKDGDEYIGWMRDHNILPLISVRDETYTAQCFCMSDRIGCQIIGFYPGAMNNDIYLSIKDEFMHDSSIDLVVIAPTIPNAMAKYVDECINLKIPYIFDPGFQTHVFTKDELINGITHSRISIFNETEFDAMMKKTKTKKVENLLKNHNIIIRTLGGDGCDIFKDNEFIHVESCKKKEVVDTTGAGDAFRGGLIYAYLNRLDLVDYGRYGCVSASFCVENRGATDYFYNKDSFMMRYVENYISK